MEIHGHMKRFLQVKDTTIASKHPGVEVRESHA
jgi:hypothetical protein